MNFRAATRGSKKEVANGFVGAAMAVSRRSKTITARLPGGT
jgi:hypothetical protein